MSQEFNVWEGIYNDFDDAPSIGSGFESETWVQKSVLKIKDVLKQAKRTENYVFENIPLYTIASIVYSEKKSLKVLDFGGGMGNTYVPLVHTLPQSTGLDFWVVEGHENVCAAKKIFEKDAHINFSTTLPETNDVDIVHISSSLQYIDDWESLISLLSKYNAQYFIFTDLPAGNIKHTYVSLQNYYESKIAHTFFKLEDILTVLKKFGYELILKNNFQANILQVNKHYPQNNFPEEFRIKYGKNLVFKRVK
ncbi:hypothetical protein Arnit_2556 [Arcobacter nitrofigilis DSM 7299]|uniref:Methyltransferase, TIGR04325 family n=1 Tax=Arcobacter nitrofigilis (strain ATCC 33309 / DSM 7299 / CCUG 15893 / LMG 7604 / NCTC 12251 / CI) TaxID=572480 RepID=D5V6D5_ARCNC|nr:TIGR04325 family methyltransferase [Arcobacter nitrofigilis]ADG94205.1 hypothetical protein Arnit_2556 [Arcobacter nitrofigilis DSM 7299]